MAISPRLFLEGYRGIPYIQDVIAWIENDLQRSLDDLTEISISWDVIEVNADGYDQWKKYNPLHTGTFTATFHTDESRQLLADINVIKAFLAKHELFRFDELEALVTSMTKRLPIYEKRINK